MYLFPITSKPLIKSLEFDQRHEMKQQSKHLGQEVDVKQPLGSYQGEHSNVVALLSRNGPDTVRSIVLSPLNNNHHNYEFTYGSRSCQLRKSEKTPPQPHRDAHESSFVVPVPNHQLSLYSHTNKTDNNALNDMMTSTMSTTMKHHDRHGYWDDNMYQATRTRSRAIAIKRNKPRGATEDHSHECTERMYDDSTWAMYLRIVQYRQQHPLSYSHADERSKGSVERTSGENVPLPGRGLEKDSRSVGFYDMDEEIFDMEL